MIKVLLAYPHEHVERRPYDLNGTFICVGDDDLDWSEYFIGPDPSHVSGAAKRLCEFSPTLIIPLSEEAVLACGRASTHLELNAGISMREALRCTDRREQRSWLEQTGLNPRWWTYGRSPFPSDIKLVAKAPASTLSRGVQILEPNVEHDYVAIARDVYNGARKEVSRLVLAGYIPPYPMILEEYLLGPQYEVCGISTDDVVFCFRPLRHHWDEEERCIVEYEPIDHDDTALELVEAAIKAVNAIGLTWCGWCVEIRGPPWRIIEVNARLGEDDKDYNQALDPEMNPVERLVVTIEAAL